ncbi:hypothetical protein KUCAC02_032778 [Chaenocephalus aceratus]|nr:hypothetical protein KUCAC02_032778 [Chaenocephalus aceratus]
MEPQENLNGTSGESHGTSERTLMEPQENPMEPQENLNGTSGESHGTSGEPRILWNLRRTLMEPQENLNGTSGESYGTSPEALCPP